jgi:pimeloyl-ACP methyl ester carboxylesterase
MLNAIQGLNIMPTLTRSEVTLYYELEGAGPPAVYVSGLGSHSNDVLAVTLRQTVAQHYRVLAVDNRGSGQTVVGAGASVTIDDMADDIAAVMDAHAMRDAQVLGVSMGGCVALTLALRHPDKVHSLIAAVTFAAAQPAPNRSDFMVRTTREMRDRGVPNDLINRFTAIFLVNEEVFKYQPIVDAWVNAPLDPFQQSREGLEQQLDAIRQYDVLERLKTLTMPTLVMSSPDDLLVPPRYQDEIAAAIPNAEIKRYPGGHVFMLIPLYAQPFYQDIFAFWGAHPNAS